MLSPLLVSKSSFFLMPTTTTLRVRTRSSARALVLALFCLLGANASSEASETGEIFSDGLEQGLILGWDVRFGTARLAPPEICTPPLAPVDTSGATTVGTGTPASCTSAALTKAVASNNGAIRFDCGAAPHTITLTSQLEIDDDLVIDGGGLITLSGGGTTRIISFRPPWMQPRTLTVQNLTFRNGSTASLPGTDVDNGGAAIYRGTDGILNVIGSHFYDNTGPVTGQDVAGGAIYSRGSTTTTIVGSVFQNNSCSSGGALGHLFANLTLVNTVIEGNTATGTGGNPATAATVAASTVTATIRRCRSVESSSRTTWRMRAAAA